MPREKSIRKLNFKPIVTSYIPENGEFEGVSTLLHEELEAIYLMDVLNLYQEDAAKSMEVSRPTFTRILKNARQKLTHALVGGYKIVLEDTKHDVVLAFCTQNLKHFDKISPSEEYLVFYQLKNSAFGLIQSIPNPVYTDEQKPAEVLPKILMEHKVNIFVSSKMGEGLKNSLISKGIKPMVKETVDLKVLAEEWLE
jgi:predicted DNA-binding protein (UPF0251 family)/predicted Fe-Mo cluster-binding NifX family protein